VRNVQTVIKNGQLYNPEVLHRLVEFSTPSEYHRSMGIK
jgi:hypothetical protein